MVIFHADWASKCAALTPLFAKLSVKYGSDERRWGRVDLEQHPELADEFSIEVSPPNLFVLCFFSLLHGTGKKRPSRTLAPQRQPQVKDPWKAKAQLPTVIFFYGGREVKRLPSVAPSGKVRAAEAAG